MNILASYDWLKEYVALKETPEDFASRLSLSGPGVERIHPQGQDLDKIVVGQVVSVKPHPNADKLRLAIVDVGKAKRTIVCGGSNLKMDQWGAVAETGAKIHWHGEGELVQLKQTEIRGVTSEGMICAANEIGLFDAFPHAEREILDLGTALPNSKLKAGTPLGDLLGLSSDVVMDIEVTTNRPDAMCMVGLAREASAILKRAFLWKPAPKIKPGKAPLFVQIADKKTCPRFMLIKLDGVKVGPSPWWMKRRLLSAGVRPINNIVDITNFVTLELGQPMHVYDASKLKGGLVVRRARAGENMQALDGKDYELDDEMLIVADENGPVDIVGVMGGEETGVTPDSTSVIFEAATVDPVSIRRTARKLNLYSNAQALFEKGLSTEAPPLALARAVELCLELANGSVSSKIFDSSNKKYKPLKYSIKTAEVTTLIGVPLPVKDMKDTLQRLGFKLQASSYQLQAIVPWWRDHDIESGRDLVEEIARVYGYANLPPVFPAGLATRPRDEELVWEERIRQFSKAAGLTETYTYSFVSRDLLEKAGYDPGPMLRVQNPLSADFEFMRTSLLPSLLQVVEENQERFREQKIFEVAHVYYPKAKDWSDLPDEQLELGAAFLGGNDAWRQAKGFAEYLYQSCGVQGIEWKRLDNDAFWHPGRTVQAYLGEHLLGTIGEVHPAIAQRFKMEGRVALIDMPIEEVLRFATTTKVYAPLPTYPEAKRDLALIVDRMAEVQSLAHTMQQVSPFLANIEWFDTYVGKGVPADKKSVAFHLTFMSADRTLETQEVDAVLEKIIQKLKQDFHATVRT